MHTLRQDVAHGLRLLWKSPAFTIVGALTLALGIGANTAIFSMVSWLLLRPLPVQRPMELVELAYQQRHGNVQNQFSVPEYREIREQSTAQFEDIAAYQIGLDGLSVEHRAERLMTYYVTGNFFSTLGLKPALGRLLLTGEGDHPGADPVLVLGYAYWKSRFNSDPSVVGKKVLLNGHPFTIVGVGPEGFHGPYPILEAQAYLPLGMQVIEGTPADFLENRGRRNLVVLARLRSGVALEQQWPVAECADDDPPDAAMQQHRGHGVREITGLAARFLEPPSRTSGEPRKPHCLQDLARQQPPER